MPQKNLFETAVDVATDDIDLPQIAGVHRLSQPYFQTADEKIKIYQADAIEFLKSLPTSSVDIIVTDPAYSGMNQHLQLGSGRIIGKYADKDISGKWFTEFHDKEENYLDFLCECSRVLKDDRHIFIMFDSYSLLTLAPIVRDVFELKNIIVWDKVNIGMGHYFRRRHEFILFASKGKRSLNNRATPDIWRIKRLSAPKYPTQKPVEIFEAMLSGSVEEDFLVCDPFLGSGSSGVAAMKWNCRFMGCDISDEALKKSASRLDVFNKTQVDNLQPRSLLVEGEEYKWLNNGKSA